MKEIDQIVSHPLFRMSIKKVNRLEADRIFCCHGIEHGLDVARMAYITVLERSMPFSKEIVYAAALLHDIGRWQQYAEGIPHHEASERLAQQILAETDFTEYEIEQIIRSIRSHRDKEKAKQDSLAQILYTADKQSRVCWLCGAYEACCWPEDKKNRSVIS